MNFWVKCSEQTKAFTNMTMALKAENPGLELKPFPTCETCNKWKTDDCKVAVEGNVFWDGIGLPPTKKDLLQDPPRDFFCAGHSDFNPNNGGNK